MEDSIEKTLHCLSFYNGRKVCQRKCKHQLDQQQPTHYCDALCIQQKNCSSIKMSIATDTGVSLLNCEAQARVRQGSARDGSQGERPQRLNSCLELTLKLVATFPPPPTTHPQVSIHFTNGLILAR